MIKKNIGERVFEWSNYVFLTLLSVVTFYPLWHEISISLSSAAGAMRGGLFLWPRGFTLEAYGSVLSSSFIWLAYRNSIIVAVLGTVMHVLFTATTAYPLNRKSLPGVKVLTFLIIFTMLFGGGLIPTYLLVKSLGMVNTLWALMIPGLISAFNVIVMQSFMRTIPEELEESATMDGANPLRIFFTMILPLCKPVLATIALWECVALWNNFMQALIYLNKKSLFTLPLLLKEIIAGQQLAAQTGQFTVFSAESAIAATVILSILPILAVYPYMQKYFMKGTMLGSVKS
ncbi:carbohydrate ABC transporter permease [Paenibacillus aceris]|uniref:ABC-type glycerol-3-phosphate transport system permease component n=1 Tax=Paenibacillus aceris TaxID=869555 RepID=A0ABS4I2C1_9BACL|nr:carbohydrate ABC transporter permease [Paenibacillus aceris]MBP1965052.1 ABC-type glycerol-3-phosphate transport system permease component [Paenibacillus aceris]NHW33037.1 carbohydrate ABC transporter permease [Paenibacillus aceris]